MTLNTITKRVADVNEWVKRQFGDESGVQITDGDILRWLNQAQLEIANKAKVIQAVSTSDLVVGTYQYTLPVENAIEIVALTVNGIPIAGYEFQMAQEYVLTADPQRTQRGFPQVYWRWADKLYFWPTPDTAYVGGISLYYTKAPAALIASSDFLGLPDKYFEALIQYVMSKAYELDEDQQASQTALQNFNDRLGQQFDEEQAETLFYPKISFVED